jgi:fatty acid desaturase
MASTASSRVEITVNGVTHDVTEWLAFHPGGSSIIQSYAGRDATDVFMVMHSQQAYEKLERMARAWPDNAKKDTVAKESALDRDFRQLNADLHREGLYRCSKLWYLYKSITTIAIGIISFLIVSRLQQYFVGALMLGLMFQQFGWLAHDICHHQGFSDRKLGDWFGLLFGAVANGFSPTWWKNKHNTHHATTNVIDCDPDIDNLPLLAFDKTDIARASPWSLHLIRFQSWYFHPVISFLKVSWCQQSLCFVYNLKKHPSVYFRKQQKKEAVALALHYTWYLLFIALTMPSISKAIMFLIVSQLTGGYLIAFVVLLNHMHLPKLDSAKPFPEWVKLQIATTVNVRKGVLTDWVFGGLNYQIEHHLFPNFPRHNLSKVMNRVRAICKRHDVPYSDPRVGQALHDLLTYVEDMEKLADTALRG